MKKRIGLMFVANFYTYTVYEITDARGGKFYIAEPRGEIGATRSASTTEELQEILNNDKPILDYISRERTKSWKAR